MTIKCGFFDSVDRDRLYNAEDMSRPYELLVSDGVYATPQGTPSNYLQVYANGGMNLLVKAGWGKFKNKWFENDSDLVLTLASAEVTLPRIDTVVAVVDMSEGVRAGSIAIKKGTPASSPSAPKMTRTSSKYEYRLADVRINPNVTSITQSVITDRRGSADCPWVTSLIKQVDTSTLFEQFQTGFDEWFTNIKETVSTATLIRSYSSSFTTTGSGQTVIPINIPAYQHLTDILQVYVNGLLLTPGVEYSTPNNNTSITLTNGLDVGTPITFIVYKSVDGSDAESVVTLVDDLQGEIQTTNTEISALNQVVAVIKDGDGFNGEIDVPGAIRCHGVQVAYSNANNENVQLGSTACDTLIHGADNITLDARLETLSLVPVKTSSYQIGNASLRYNGIYLVNSPNVSSDRNLKQDIEEADGDELFQMIRDLQVVNYAFKDEPETQRIGLIAQDVLSAGGEKYVEISEDGLHSIKPMDLIYPLIASVQKLAEENEELKRRIEALEE